MTGSEGGATHEEDQRFQEIVFNVQRGFFFSRCVILVRTLFAEVAERKYQFLSDVSKYNRFVIRSLFPFSAGRPLRFHDYVTFETYSLVLSNHQNTYARYCEYYGDGITVLISMVYHWY
jgi:hypothetical protein